MLQQLPGSGGSRHAPTPSVDYTTSVYFSRSEMEDGCLTHIARKADY